MEIVNQVLKAKENENPEKTEEILKEIKEKVENNIQTEAKNEKTKIEPSNCLAMTVKEEYRVTVVKNVIKKGLRITWKIAISIITMNFLNTFL